MDCRLKQYEDHVLLILALVGRSLLEAHTAPDSKTSRDMILQ